MTHSQPCVQASYALCRRKARQSGSSFYAAFLLLPRQKRRAMDALYAFTRHTDDLADNAEPLEVRREALAQWRGAVEAVLEKIANTDRSVAPLRGVFRAGGTVPGETLLPALADTVRRFAIPREHLLAVIDGVAMDLSRVRYETFDDLTAYCERVASAVGLACTHIWGVRGEAAFEPARKCGIAFQVTNILRDLREDIEQGRVYLPLEDLRRCEYSVEDLAAGVVDERFERLMELEIDRARRFYHEGAELFDWLEPDGRRVFGMMTTVYHRLLEQIARRPNEVFRRRVGLSRWRKLGIAARWALLPARRSALP
ncbi:MAG TPA: phytoene/squalene synthase family protein [Thermoguttaceae bacterium]|nr:phytoene/squalene synthase family protein [Thermoguttaceae bacterium]